MGPVVLLGPQRFEPSLGEAVARVGVEGRLASVTAGWQEREAEDLELHEHLGQRTINLQLHARGEDVFARDPELFEAHRERQERLMQLQRIYRRRLDSAREAAWRLLHQEGDPEVLGPERTDAIRAIARLDAHHLSRVGEIDRVFDERWRPTDRPVVRRHVEAIERQLDGVAGVAIAGGHVALLLNRMRLFGLGQRIGERPVFAWSAGAMAVCERIVLFHDTPPQGQGIPEVLEHGLGLLRRWIALPHARRRLLLDDRTRVSLFVERFRPDRCLALDDGQWVFFENGRPRAVSGARRLRKGGDLVEVRAA